MQSKFTGSAIRQEFIDFFVAHGHTFVPSASLVPGGDSTLLFTNAGMVQFKDVFLGSDKRPYTRAVNSQKVLRVAGKHNDLDEVGRDGSHHTFFEMLGNWSFGDYYKKEAISWAWQLLTEVWKIPGKNLYATCFKDDKGNIPQDDEAAEAWKVQPGFVPSHVLFFGRKENFWEMADTGPCGPCSEIHIDRGPKYCDKQSVPGHICQVNGDCARFLELWNNVFIQYNRLDANTLEPLPARHVDTGMGFERIVSVLQDVDSDYKIDLFKGALDVVRGLTGDSEKKMLADFTPYRVIADHARAAAFLIADGVVPGNTGRNYICRMIIRRASRFGTKLGLHEPFLAKVAGAIVASYGDFYPDLVKHQTTVFEDLTREEIRFARTVESGTAYLQGMLDELKGKKKKVLDGARAFDLYATYGLPFEITRDIAREQDLEVDEAGFQRAMDEHRLASGGGKAMGVMSGEDAEFYNGLRQELAAKGQLGQAGVEYDPYGSPQVETRVLALVVEGRSVGEAQAGDEVEVVLPKTSFYVESGGQVSDTGSIRDVQGKWEIEVTDMRKPAAGMVVHKGEVVRGQPKAGEACLASVDWQRRHDIMRNHTATHLLHAALHAVLGEHARQAGSLVAPDRLRFDFNHPEAMTSEQLESVEKHVNAAVAADMPVLPVSKPREQAIAEGAMALFGEKYGEVVRTITIASENIPPADEKTAVHSYELCGGTHLERTSDVGTFIIVSEGSAAAGVRRIEAGTGRGAYELIARRNKALKQAAGLLSATPESVPEKIEALQEDLAAARKQIVALRQETASASFEAQLANVPMVNKVPVLALEVPNADADTLRQLADRFRQRFPSGVSVLASAVDGRPTVIAAVTEDLVKRGLHAGELVKFVAAPLGGSGGGKPTLAQAGGKDPGKLAEALASVSGWVKDHLSDKGSR